MSHRRIEQNRGVHDRLNWHVKIPKKRNKYSSPIVEFEGSIVIVPVIRELCVKSCSCNLSDMIEIWKEWIDLYILEHQTTYVWVVPGATSPQWFAFVVGNDALRPVHAPWRFYVLGTWKPHRLDSVWCDLEDHPSPSRMVRDWPKIEHARLQYLES